MQVRFDAYTATTRSPDLSKIMGMCWFPADGVKHGRGHHGFEERISFVGQDGAEAASVQHGGSHGDLVMIEVKGERTPEVVNRLRQTVEHHRCTRVDSCIDFDEPGSFDYLLGHCIEVKKGHKLKGSKAGDWDDYPEDGRTLYLGAPTSAVRARLYEKGRQPEYRFAERPDWARMEVQVRPMKEAKETYSTLDARGVWGASKWTRELAGRILAAELTPMPAGTVRKQTSRDAAIRFMCKQYGAHLLSLIHELGSADKLGWHLFEQIKNSRTMDGEHTLHPAPMDDLAKKFNK